MRVVIALLVLLAALPARADDEVELKLLPKAQKGQAEEIGFEVTINYGDESEDLTGKMRREVRSLDEDGLPATESMELLNGDYRHEQPRSSYSTSPMGGGAKSVKRSGRTRIASSDFVDLSHVTFKHTKDVVAALRRDPDGLARAIQPDDKMKVDDRWEVEPKDLLALYVGGKTKLQEGSKAVATLESLHKKDGKTEATISLKATVIYTTPDDPDVKYRLAITAQIRGPIDGSTPPRKEKVDLTHKEGDQKKFVEHITFERTPAEKDDDEEDPKKEKEEKKKKPEKEK